MFSAALEQYSSRSLRREVTIKVMKILLIGPQGSGKSTQAKLLAEYLKVPFISTGDIFREMAQKPADLLGRMVKKILDEGKLVDDETTSKIVKDRLSQPDCQSGFVIDGYPRTLEQVKIFDPEFDQVFYLDVPEEEVIKRLVKRGRADDTEELIRMRLNLYYQQTQPLLDYYRNLRVLLEIDGTGSIEEVQDKIRKQL